MGHKDSNSEEQHRLLRKETTLRIRLPQENQREAPRGGQEPDAAAVSSAGCEFRLEKRWLIDPHLLFVGAKIGEGAHGKVYEGRYGDMSVAVKVLQRAETSEEQAKLEARFAREVDMMSRVQHRNLVKVLILLDERTECISNGMGFSSF